jgi:Flp pilus assembly protein TadG
MTKVTKQHSPTPSIIRNDSGAVAILFALFLGVFIPLLALVLDYGRAVAVEAAMANGADAAALAGAVKGGDDEEMEAEARKYFAANMTSGQYVTTFDKDNIKVEISEDSIAVTPTATKSKAYILTGQRGDFVAVSTVSAVSLPQSVGVPVDYFLILDESGSMSATDISPKTNQGVRKNIALRHSVELMLDKLFANYKPGGDPLKGHRVAYISYATQRQAVTELQHDPLVLRNKLPMHTGASGTTCASCGISWAKNMYYSSVQDRKKVYIIMTDGIFNRSLLSGEDPVDEAIAFCSGIKSLPNTDIWTVGFGTNVSSKPLLACASKPDQFKIAANGLELGDFFKEVAKQTGFLRIIQ